MEKFKELIARSEKAVGRKEVLRGITEGTIWCVIVSEDADQDIKDEIESAAFRRGAELRWTPSKDELGRLAGIKVAAACVGLKKESAKNQL
ncbi:MAG TPA: ribosomal L7Ae/L30e/S12e/Gadd45 family protein [Eubacteriales bacterium]|jgi:ribosomal protein L7Ae-like RNA K-turn-binding protein|nr:ribosomal L7Ae/L30e/S12e/Gadd45 family protein [Clostridia bacterium]HRR90044.1 ribosomal L7Ae/L30e/S12e/Gadd45 family protein [Eubacteriales bacterium]HRU84906.1 ribosomal L7Ae/L30e/S12e/Gadd45 family protein [Eubacteriales bacterium]